MSAIINRVKEIYKQNKDAEDEVNRITYEKQRMINDKLDSLVKSIIAKIKELDGENTKYGKLYISEPHSCNEKLRVYCGNESGDKHAMLLIILKAGIYIYEDNLYDYSPKVHSVPRVDAEVFDPDSQYKSETVSTNIFKIIDNIHESFIVEEFINNLGLVLYKIGCV